MPYMPLRESIGYLIPSCPAKNQGFLRGSDPESSPEQFPVHCSKVRLLNEAAWGLSFVRAAGRGGAGGRGRSLWAYTDSSRLDLRARVSYLGSIAASCFG